MHVSLRRELLRKNLMVAFCKLLSSSNSDTRWLFWLVVFLKVLTHPAVSAEIRACIILICDHDKLRVSGAAETREKGQTVIAEYHFKQI